MKANLSTPPEQQSDSKKKVRNSNLELYRILVMLLIVAHHYVVNSGLIQVIGENPYSPSAIPMLLFGAWGKTGINCFVLITGYFMCRSNYTLGKLLKLYLQVLFYTVIIYTIFLITGHESLSFRSLFQVIVPIFDLSPSNFVGCFIVFYLFIPFLNILINSMTKKEHGILTLLAVVCYSLLPTLAFRLPVNYIGWFSILYLIASYIRLHGFPLKVSHAKWGVISFVSILISSLSIVAIIWAYRKHMLSNLHLTYFFIADSNKILALIIGVSSFMYFKDLRIPHSRMINLVGGATFGVLLIHANSNAMRQWLWKETVDCVGNFKDDVLFTIGYAVVIVVTVFVVCAGIDWFRARYVEPKLVAVVEKILSKPYNRLKSKFQY